MSIDYKSYDFQVYEYLIQLQQELKRSIRCPQTEKWLRQVMEEQHRIKTRHFYVAVVGEFKRGKSSFVNALLGRKVLPVDTSPTTAVINRITYGDVPRAWLHYKDGSKKEVEIDKLSDYVTKLTEKSKEEAAKIKEAVIEYPSVFCQNYVDLMDTPGMNDEERMNEITLSDLERIDLAIVAVSINYPFDETECEFMVRLLENPGISQIIVVVTYIDTVCEQDRARALENLNIRIKEKVLEHLNGLYSKGEPIFEKYDRIVMNLKQFAVSSVDALKAYETGDHDLLEKSGLAKLNKELPYLILSSQNNIILQKAMTTIAHITKEYQSGIGLIVKSCGDNAEEMKKLAAGFEQKYAKYNGSLADNVKVRIYRCINRFRKNIESDVLVDFVRCCSAVRKSDVVTRQKELLCQCGRASEQINMEIKKCLNAELQQIYEEEASKAIDRLCKEMSKSLGVFSGYFSRQQEGLTCFANQWTAPPMKESAVSFSLMDAEVREVCADCQEASFDVGNTLKKIDKMISESLSRCCEGRKREMEAFCDAVFAQAYKKLMEITADLEKQAGRYQTAANASVQKIQLDKALQMRMTELYNKNAALQRQFMQELGMGQV